MRLYLVGGHMCNDATCSNNQVYTDVWTSGDVGATWRCLTSGMYATPALQTKATTYSKGIGRYYSAVLTGDDTLFIVAGHKPNTTEGLNSVMTAFVDENDAVFSSTPYLVTPQLSGAQPVLKSMEKIAIFFKENIQMGAGIINLKAAGSATTIGATSMITSQAIWITPTNGQLEAAGVYNLQFPDGAVKDVSGNAVVGMPAYSVTVHDDIA